MEHGSRDYRRELATHPDLSIGSMATMDGVAVIARTREAWIALIESRGYDPELVAEAKKAIEKVRAGLLELRGTEEMLEALGSADDFLPLPQSE